MDIKMIYHSRGKIRGRAGTLAGKIVSGSVLAAGGVLLCLPILLLLSGSITGKYEMYQAIRPVLIRNEEWIRWKLLPEYPDFSEYGRLLFSSPQFFVLFWNSITITGSILLGQLAVAVPAAWAFAVFSFPCKKILYSVYIVLMLLPFQVTMLSNYLLLNDLTLLDTRMAVILPGIFSTFPVFLIYRSFTTIPVSLLEAARMDGAGEWYLFIRIGIPMGQGGILSAFVLNFLECWNLMEQPLAFLKDRSLWPLSLYLPEIGLKQAGYAMAASVITLLLALCVFAFGQDYLEQGISASGIKE